MWIAIVMNPWSFVAGMRIKVWLAACRGGDRDQPWMGPVAISSF